MSTFKWLDDRLKCVIKHSIYGYWKKPLHVELYSYDSSIKNPKMRFFTCIHFAVKCYRLRYVSEVYQWLIPFYFLIQCAGNISGINMIIACCPPSFLLLINVSHSHAEIATGLRPAPTNQVCNQDNGHQTNQGTTHSNWNNIRAATPLTVFS